MQRALEHTVLAREDERRALRRDLHDHFAPALSGVTLKLEAAHNLVGYDDVTLRRWLEELRGQTGQTASELRTLAYNLRPPALDDMGLAGALRELATQSPLDGLAITLDVPDILPPLSAAVEVAVYRIAAEAMTNTARHARARHCCATLAMLDGPALRLTIEDDGQGLPPEYVAGVGMTSMRERAQELGGMLEIGPRPPSGVRVAATFPLRHEAHATHINGAVIPSRALRLRSGHAFRGEESLL